MCLQRNHLISGLLFFLLSFLRDIIKTFSENEAERGVLPCLTHRFSPLFGSVPEELICIHEPKLSGTISLPYDSKLGFWATNQAFLPSLVLITIKQNHAVLNTWVCLNGGSSWSEEKGIAELTKRQILSLWESNDKDFGVKCYNVVL